MPSTREVIPEDEREPFTFPSPDAAAPEIIGSYAYWEEYHKALGQELAKRIRRGT